MKLKRIILFVFFLILIFSNLQIAFADELKDITSTIKVAVCGDGIVEGGEECERENLNGKTCENLGYGEGSLTCDIACSFDISGCLLNPTITPVLTSVHSLINTSVSAPISVLTQIATSTPTLLVTPALPAVVAVFDIDGSGRIEFKEVFFVVKFWTDNWKEALIALLKGEKITSAKVKGCDLNYDRECNLVDFSILLYYIER